MYAHINLPGSKHFEYFGPASKCECREWLERRVNALLTTELLTSTLPRMVITNRDAEKTRYLSGNSVFPYIQTHICPNCYRAHGDTFGQFWCCNLTDAELEAMADNPSQLNERRCW